jgi:hypothetical protein
MSGFAQFVPGLIAPCNQETGSYDYRSAELELTGILRSIQGAIEVPWHKPREFVTGTAVWICRMVENRAQHKL